MAVDRWLFDSEGRLVCPDCGEKFDTPEQFEAHEEMLIEKFGFKRVDPDER